jgi:hypothetical protein
MKRISNTNMVSRRLISLFTVTSLLSLLLLFHLLGGTEKGVKALDTTASFATIIIITQVSLQFCSPN